MTAEALAGVLESIAVAIRALNGAPLNLAAVVQPAPAPPPPPPVAPIPAPAPAAPMEHPAAGMTMADWLPTFRQIIKDRGYNVQTLRNRGAALKFIGEHLGPRALCMIKPHEITTLLKTCSPHKAVRVLGELRDVFTEAIANNEADGNPAALVKPPRAPGIRKRLTLEIWQDMLLMAATASSMSARPTPMGAPPSLRIRRILPSALPRSS